MQKKLEGDKVDELYILSRMVAAGYVPSKLYGWRKARRPLNRTMRKITKAGNFLLDKPFDFKVAVAEKLIPRMRDRMIREKAYLVANGVAPHDFDARMQQYEAVRKDIAE